MQKVIFFDLFNTLVPGGTERERTAVNVKMAKVLGIEPEAYNLAFRRSWLERFAGALGDLETTIRAIAWRVGGDPTPEQVDLAAGLRVAMTTSLLAAVPDHTLSTLDDLRAAGWRLGLISNTTCESPDRWRKSALPPRFDAAVFSNELGAFKPDPAIYLAACRLLGIAPAGSFYLGDGADQELRAATELGMYAIRTTEHRDSDPGWTGPTIASITELPALLDRAAAAGMPRLNPSTRAVIRSHT